MTYEMIHKQTFTNQLMALPSKELTHVLQKVHILQTSPAPDAKNKKRLVGYEGAVYRIRSGDYRILYTFTEHPPWVILLGVDNRKDVYRGTQLVADAPAFDTGQVPQVDDLLAPAASRPDWTPPQAKAERHVAPTSHADDLPILPDDEILARLTVPAEFREALKACRTTDDLVTVDVPEAVRERVFDAITAPNYDQVLQKPSFVTGGIDDLLKFAEGELLGFLLKLNPEQEKYVDWAINAGGPALVKGGPGTGKSAVALYRVRSLIAALRASGTPQPRILFTTYTNALMVSSRQLLGRLLDTDADCVIVRTADKLVSDIVTAVDGQSQLADPVAMRLALQEALKMAAFDGNALQRRAQEQSISRLRPDYLLEEMNGVIDGRELATLDDYLKTSRAGRKVSLNVTQRTAVWRLYEAYRKVLKSNRLRTWQELRRRAADIARAGKAGPQYDGVIVDEAQDLDPAVLRLLVMLCCAPNRLFVTADGNQSIYGGSFRWTDVHDDLRFTGRTGILRTNHRSTRQIGEAAHAYLRDGVTDEDTAAQERTYVASGPVPTVRVVERTYDETQLLARFLPGAAKQFHLGIGSCAVLVPSEPAGKAIAARLNSAGVKARYMPGRDVDLEVKAVKVITMKSAKGLEFPIVALAGLLEGHVPGAAKGMSPEEAEEANLRERRTFYVAMTRAMRALLAIVPADHPSPLVQGFDATLWNTGTERTV